MLLKQSVAVDDNNNNEEKDNDGVLLNDAIEECLSTLQPRDLICLQFRLNQERILHLPGIVS